MKNARIKIRHFCLLDIYFLWYLIFYQADIQFMEQLITIASKKIMPKAVFKFLLQNLVAKAAHSEDSKSVVNLSSLLMLNQHFAFESFHDILNCRAHGGYLLDLMYATGYNILLLKVVMTYSTGNAGNSECFVDPYVHCRI